MASAPKQELSLFDSLSIIVGIIIGAGIYETAPTVAASMGSWQGTLGVWVAGGLLALTGALCYAELATAYPYEGGDYIYQTRAYGSWAGYLFGWTQLVIVRPGDIALMAFVFARYAQTLYAPLPNMLPVYAVLAVIVLSAINILGVREGKWTQNLLTVIKVLGLAVLILVGFLAPIQPPQITTHPVVPGGGLQLALILVLFTYGGWNEMAYVAAEVRQPKKNISRALVTGTLVVMALYVLANSAFLSALGYDAMASSQAVAVDTMSRKFPALASRVISILICISALGSINGLIFTGARISYAMGTEHATFRPMGSWNPQLGTPARALLLQGGLSALIILVAGSFLNTILYTAPVVWLFFFATGIAVFVLRRKESHVLRPYRVSGHPITTIVFCACCLYMLYNSIAYALSNRPVGLGLLAVVLMIGVLIYFLIDIRFSSARTGAQP